MATYDHIPTGVADRPATDCTSPSNVPPPDGTRGPRSLRLTTVTTSSTAPSTTADIGPTHRNDGALGVGPPERRGGDGTEPMWRASATRGMIGRPPASMPWPVERERMIGPCHRSHTTRPTAVPSRTTTPLAA